ncbi:MAG: hypothetical protein CL912_32180 [Deltaproteobacteria bacterium]|nr:hypothetical protein [Deltaproteobacteria bacterium]
MKALFETKRRLEWKDQMCLEKGGTRGGMKWSDACAELIWCVDKRSVGIGSVKGIMAVRWKLTIVL